MLELKNVTKRYQTKSGTVTALNGINLTFPSTGMVFITGKSGCGKTTLLNVIGGLDGVDDGELCILGKSFSDFSTTEYDAYRNTFIGFIFQEYNLLPEFTVEKNIKIAMELQGEEVNEEEFEELLKTVEILELRNRKPNELSGGQRQRVAIARALVKKPRIIMADEPTGALDSATGVQVLDILKKLSKDKLVIIVSHDQEFAEKYADRIVRLVDGNVEEDFSYTGKELHYNTYETKDEFIVQDGSDLSADEKDALATAIKGRKKISVIEKISYKEKKNTGEVATVKEDNVEFKSSKMKLKSTLALGVKSLGVKPLRLVFTILLSAIAFAVFGLFDAVANFSTPKVINNLLKSSPYPSISVYGEYVLNAEEGEKYEVKLSDDALSSLSKKTGYNFKGVYDFRDNTDGFVSYAYSIKELSRSVITKGANYYLNDVSGIIEYGADEIDSDGNIGNLGIKLVKGKYPEFRYEDENKVILIKDSVDEIAISTYMAESIFAYLQGEPLNGEKLTTPEDIIGKRITIDENKYTVVGLIDCGKIPKKYEVLKTTFKDNQNTVTLAQDFNTYIYSGAHTCIFTAKGYLEELNKQYNGGVLYHSGNSKWSMTIGNAKASSTLNYFYNSSNYNYDNIILFTDTYMGSGEVELADNEVLIHAGNLRYLFNEQYENSSIEDKRSITNHITILNALNLYSRQDKQDSYKKIMDLLSVGKDERVKEVKLTKFSSDTGTVITKTLKVVGIYFGIDTNKTVSSTFKLMMNENLMSEFDIYTGQGEYNRLLAKTTNNRLSMQTISQYMAKDSGLKLNWYGNTALTVIGENEPAIRQSADLFLYVAIVLAVFSAFMFFNYIVTSIVNKRPSIGVLRGLGSNRKDILLMFTCESIIIALINALLATVFTAVGCIFVNMYINNVMNIAIPFAIFSVRQFLLILGVSTATAIISSALPIIKISKEKPVDLIRKP